MKNKILLILLSITLLLPAGSWAVDNVLTPIDEPIQAEEINEPVSEYGLPKENFEQEYARQTPIVQETAPTLPYKNPISKKTLVKKFLQAMIYVGICSALLYVAIIIYKNTKAYPAEQIKNLEGETPLTTPNDIESAIKTFLDKTKW